MKWLDRLERQDPPVSVPSAMTTLHSWYAYLTRHELCNRNPFDRLGDPSPEPAPRLTRHGPLASAVLVDYAETRALQARHDASAREIAWRNAALLSIWFYAGITPRRLLPLNMDALTIDRRHLALAIGDDDPFALPHHAAQPLRAYLERRGDRREQRLTELTGPLLASISPAATHSAVPPRADSPLTNPDVLAVMHEYAAACALPSCPRLTVSQPKDAPSRSYADDRTVLLITEVQSSQPENMSSTEPQKTEGATGERS